MSRKGIASLFVIYFILLVLYGALSSSVGVWRREGFAGVIGEAIGIGFVVYVISGMLPFAVWGARGFRTANAKSLFIPWAILAVLIIALQEYGRSHP